MKRLMLLVVTVLAIPALAVDVRVANVSAFDAAVKSAVAGDSIILQPGEWKDADLTLRGAGTADRPITIRAAEPGAVKLTGTSRLGIAGEYLIIEGLWFHNCTPPNSDVITFREDAKRVANNCVLRNCAVTADVPVRDATTRKWLSLYGIQNRVERCHFEGKTSAGTLLVVWLAEAANAAPAKHQIVKNYFGPRPRLGKNGGEIIRIGDSNTSMQTAGCMVEGNFFEKCDGEVECISNKSCGNVYRGNTFLECQGTLTLRHGNACVVEGNVFLGNDRKETGGIRVIGEDHRVTGNYLEGLQGDDARAALCLMNGIENSPLNGYFQVKRAVIEANTVVSCRQSLNIGYADDDVKALLPPIECVLRNNTFWAAKHRVVEIAEPSAQVTWVGNDYWGEDLGIAPRDGITRREFPRPTPPTIAEAKERGVTWKLTLQGKPPASDRDN